MRYTVKGELQNPTRMLNQTLLMGHKRHHLYLGAKSHRCSSCIFEQVRLAKGGSILINCFQILTSTSKPSSILLMRYFSFKKGKQYENVIQVLVNYTQVRAGYLSKPLM